MRRLLDSLRRFFKANNRGYLGAEKLQMLCQQALAKKAKEGKCVKIKKLEEMSKGEFKAEDATRSSTPLSGGRSLPKVSGNVQVDSQPTGCTCVCTCGAGRTKKEEQVTPEPVCLPILPCDTAPSKLSRNAAIIGPNGKVQPNAHPHIFTGDDEQPRGGPISFVKHEPKENAEWNPIPAEAKRSGKATTAYQQDTDLINSQSDGATQSQPDVN